VYVVAAYSCHTSNQVHNAKDKNPNNIEEVPEDAKE
jgi:hypothetical protein